MQETQLLNGDEIIAVMRQVHGLDVSIYNETFLAKSVQRRQTATAIKEFVDYIRHLSENRLEAEFFFKSLSCRPSCRFTSKRVAVAERTFPILYV